MTGYLTDADRGRGQARMTTNDSPLADAIDKALKKHGISVYAEGRTLTCQCGKAFGDSLLTAVARHRAHVLDAIIAAIEAEWGPVEVARTVCGSTPNLTCLVTPWRAERGES